MNTSRFQSVNHGRAASSTSKPVGVVSSDSMSRAVIVVKDLMKHAAGDINELTLSAVLDFIAHSNAIDDRKMLLEHILAFTLSHPSNQVQDLAHNFVTQTLYNDLAHPPTTFIGPMYAFRTADGSNNNPDSPDLGRAGTPYARCVPQGNPLPRNQLPDAGLVFDTLLRRDQFRKHPGGLSSLMFSFATLIIDSVFRTSHMDTNINMTSGYVDLAPLYGSDQAAQNKCRIRDGRGCLHPDTVSEDRLLLLPPATIALLVLFNRNHNYIARRLLEINERGTWVDPSTLMHDTPKLVKQEEEIFQIARLCNCAWFAAIMFSDYFSAILGLVRKGSRWNFESFGEMHDDLRLFERGRGNACSVEFNCLYRWHATTSLQEEQLLKRYYTLLFPDRHPEDVTVADFYKTEAMIQASEPDLSHWTFGSLKRQEDGRFRDSDLASILQNSTSHHAAAFGARGTPGIKRLNEIMGIEANRTWGVCSLNDFRKFLGLKTYLTFEEWNPNKEVAEAARKLYGHIDHLELYVGLQAEDTKPMMDGAGLCSGYTISRAILADAISLVRRDRFFVQDFTPYNMTSWGFSDCQRDPNGWGFGSTLGRLLLRTLPYDYEEKSVYTWFPFINPEAMYHYLGDLGQRHNYSFEFCKTRVPATSVSQYAEVMEVLRDVESFTAVSWNRAAEVIKGKGFFCASDDSNEIQEFISALAPSLEGAHNIGQYFYEKTRELISAASYSLVNTRTRGLNVVEVLKQVPVYWAASEIAGIPLGPNSTDAYSPQELHDILGEIYQFIFLDVEPARYMVMKQKVQGHIEKLCHYIKANLGFADSPLSKRSEIIFDRRKDLDNGLLKRLLELGHSNEQVVNEILALLVGMTVEVSLALTNVLNLLLELDVASLVKATNADINGSTLLEMHVIEALRIDPPFVGMSVIAKNRRTIGSLTVQRNEHLFLDVVGANMDGKVFTNPTTFDPTRSIPHEGHLQASISFKVVGPDIAPKLIAHVQRSILSLDNVRRGPGQSGQLKRFKDSSFRDLRYAYLEAHQFRSPWPTSMVILYDTPL